jgi:hypothetical protein
MAAGNLTDSRQTEVLVVAWVMTGLAIFTVGVKLFARAKIVRIVGWDDFFIFFSLVRRFAPELSGYAFAVLMGRRF